MGRGGARLGAGRPQTAEKTKPIRIPERMLEAVTAFVSAKGYKYPLYAASVSAGFPVPADDHVEAELDLNELLIKQPAATFLVQASGESMLNVGIHPGDTLVVDKSIKPAKGKIVIASVDGHLTVKRLDKAANGNYQLLPENEKFKPIEISPESDVHILGVVTNVIHPL